MHIYVYLRIEWSVSEPPFRSVLSLDYRFQNVVVLVHVLGLNEDCVLRDFSIIFAANLCATPTTLTHASLKVFCGL